MTKTGQVLATVKEAAQEVRLSPSFLYHLPKDTPGIYRFGKSLRVDVVELKEWARQCVGAADSP